MKKTLYLAIASATAFAAATATAGTVYENDGLSLDVSGEVDVQYKKATAKDSDAELRYDDVQISFEPTYTDDSGITAFSYFQVDFKNETADLGDVNVGLEISNVTITVGDDHYASDNLGIGQDVEFGVAGALNNTSGDETIRLDYDMDALFLSASVDFAEKKEVQDPNDPNETIKINDETSFDVYAAYTIDDSITVAGTFQTRKANEDADSTIALGVSVEYSADALTAGAEVTYTDEKATDNLYFADGVTYDGITAFEIAAAYDVSEKLTVGGGFGMQMLSANISGTDIDDPMQVYGNVQYNVVGKATAYGELQYDIIDDNAGKTEIGYAVGMKVKF